MNGIASYEQLTQRLEEAQQRAREVGDQRDRAYEQVGRLRGTLAQMGAEIEAAGDLAEASYQVTPEIKGLFWNWSQAIAQALAGPGPVQEAEA